MNFAYVAKRKNGETVRDEIEAESVAAARQLLRRDGLFVVSVSPKKAAGPVNVAKVGFSFGQRVNSTDLMMFMSQMTIMCQSGVDLAEALTNVCSQVTKPKLRETLEKVAEDVRNGISFSEAASKHPSVFSTSFIAGITAGEQSGEIDSVLERLTQLMRKDVKLKGAIWSMLMYPLVLCCITAMVFAALMFFVLPQFATVFTDLDKPAPPLTAALLSLGATLRSNVIAILISAGVLAVSGLYVSRLQSFHIARDRFLLRFFLLRSTTSCLIAGRLLRLLGTLLSSGVPLVDCIRLCRRSTKNRLFQDLFEKVEDGVMHGEGLAKKMFDSNFLPKGAAQMIKTAESSGRLGDILQTLGEFYEDEGERHLRDLVKIAEPAIIVGLGGVVAVIVLAVLVPLLDVTTAAA